MFVLGGYGSGKTTAVQAAIGEALYKLGAKIPILVSTGRIAATYQAKYQHLDVDTIHGALSRVRKVSS